ncbi:MAG TPA: sulfotransferase [Woeseiaceae bacterium]|nr:sulfotransferase [Woeseiaceae bacterium]
MDASPQFRQAFERARELQARGSRVRAERAYRQLLAQGEERELVLRRLVDLYMESRRADEAIAGLVALTEEVPDRLYYYARLATLLEDLGRRAEAIACYRRLLNRQPELADAHYNLALLYKKEKRYAEAAAAYERAIRLGIERAQDVYCNLGVLYAETREPARAREMYERALAVEPAHVPSMFNLGGLHEESGEKEKAEELYRRILAAEPGHSGALARLVHASRITNAGNPLLARLHEAMEAAKDDFAREELWFARGKALDDLGDHEEAFAAFGTANRLGRRRGPRYDRRATEQAFDRLIDTFDREWIGRAATDCRAAPIFICGMFRSGSTLIEQILSAHPSITAGGEVDRLQWLIARRLAPYPQRARDASPAELRELGDAYLAHLRDIARSDADDAAVTDKRPDNFLHLGLIKALFPPVRIVYTKRDPADNCLSIYFQPLGRLSYATDLENTAHYYGQHERLMRHWQACFPENIFTVDYDELVREPRAVFSRLFEFLGLAWEDNYLNLAESATPAKTASLWQVREALHERSSGRWRNYAPFLKNIEGPWR